MDFLVEAHDLYLSCAGPCPEYIDPDCCVVSGNICGVDHPY